MEFVRYLEETPSKTLRGDVTMKPFSAMNHDRFIRQLKLKFLDTLSAELSRNEQVSGASVVNNTQSSPGEIVRDFLRVFKPADDAQFDRGAMVRLAKLFGVTTQSITNIWNGAEPQNLDFMKKFYALFGSRIHPDQNAKALAYLKTALSVVDDFEILSKWSKTILTRKVREGLTPDYWPATCGLACFYSKRFSFKSELISRQAKSTKINTLLTKGLAEVDNITVRPAVKVKIRHLKPSINISSDVGWKICRSLVVPAMISMVALEEIIGELQ